MRTFFFIILLSSVLFLLFACKTKSALVEEPKFMGNIEKFDFDINALDEDGLIGPASGKVAVDYEFCFPKGEEYEKALFAIDPNIKLFPKTKGRSACSDSQSLAIGTTHTANHKEILMKLSALDFVKRIRRVWYE